MRRTIFLFHKKSVSAGKNSYMDIINGITKAKRRAFMILTKWSPLLIITGFFLLLFIIFGTYKGYRYTQSNEFCGMLCHKVMGPQYETHFSSPHAKIKCGECHVNTIPLFPLTMSGMRNIKGALFHTFPRPIPTPLKATRPSRETCRQCHGKAKSMSSFERRYNYFLTEGDEEWDRWLLRMLISSGCRENQEKSDRVHTHEDVSYVAEDQHRQHITWIKSVDKQGKETVYVTEGSKYAENAPPEEMVRKMDCIDCHSRTSHNFTAPYRAVNRDLANGSISPEIPEIKQKAIEVLEKQYTSRSQAVQSIETGLNKYYKETHPDYYRENKSVISIAVQGIADIYENTMFPEMKIRWDVYPDHVGHLITPGCFRCHDGEHRSSKGEAITRKCNACHTIIEQGPPEAVEKSIDGLYFRHPTDIDGEWKDTGCTECHTGGEVDI
jgi:hypothetical protein